MIILVSSFQQNLFRHDVNWLYNFRSAQSKTLTASAPQRRGVTPTLCSLNKGQPGFPPFSARRLVVILEILSVWRGARSRLLKHPIYEIRTGKSKVSPLMVINVRHTDMLPTSRTVFQYWRRSATALRLLRRLVA